MVNNILKRHWVSKAKAELQLKAAENKKKEMQKVFETMIALASIGELTPERYGLLLNTINSKTGEKNE